MNTEATNVETHIPTGWHISGSHPIDYTIGIDCAVCYQGDASGTIQSKSSQQDGFATLMQNIKADQYKGSRVRLSAYVKGADISGWADLWMRIDSAQADVLGFDNMENRPITGTVDWQMPDEDQRHHIQPVLHNFDNLFYS